MWGWFLSDETIDSFEAVERSNIVGAALVQTDLLNRGFFSGPDRAIISAAHTDEHVERYALALEHSLETLQIS